ncbi:MAG: deoxyribose-phosphate aldolase [bacterium]
MNIASYIDHTILKPDATKEDIKQLCREAIQYKFASVCVNLYRTKLVHNMLKDSQVDTTTVIGFPLGSVRTDVKVCETKKAIEDGANEIDMVINVGALKDGDYDYIKDDIKKVLESCKDKAILKVIIETGLLTEEEKIKACECVVEAGADFVKTSTGFSKGGATIEDIKLMKQVVGDNVKIKASGGIRDYDTAIAMIEAGADRIGASSSVKIVTGKGSNETGY